VHKHFSLVPWQWCNQIFPLVQIGHHSLMQLKATDCGNSGLAMECLKLISWVLDLPQFLQGVDDILKHQHLLLRTEMGYHVTQ